MTRNTDTSWSSDTNPQVGGPTGNAKPTGGDDGKFITIVGSKEHNLQNVTVRIPRDKLVVMTGLSGSGKSSLAFDTIYAEGQRKYVESLSAYARQFLEQLSKPDVEHIEGLPPTVAIEQRSGSSNPRSTVATTTEIYDYLRLLFARVGEPHCWICGRSITSQTVSQMVDAVMTLPEGTRFMVLAPMIRGMKGQHADVLKHVQREGFVRARIDGVIHDLKTAPELDKNKKHTIEVVVDRLVLKESVRIRLSDSLETAIGLASGLVIITYEQVPAGSPPPTSATNGTGDEWKDWLFSSTYACPQHPQASLEELAPRMFSFNSPYGACESCDGLGTILEFDAELIVPDKTRTLSEGAIDAWRHGGKRMNIWYNRQIKAFCREHKISPLATFAELPAGVAKTLLYGGGDCEGVIPNLTRRWKNTDSEFVKA
ncbi:MAG: excinuclease ABC subunit UvrA, partial [Planctomycetaceae bacterium]